MRDNRNPLEDERASRPDADALGRRKHVSCDDANPMFRLPLLHHPFRLPLPLDQLLYRHVFAHRNGTKNLQRIRRSDDRLLPILHGGSLMVYQYPNIIILNRSFLQGFYPLQYDTLHGHEFSVHGICTCIVYRINCEYAGQSKLVHCADRARLQHLRIPLVLAIEHDLQSQVRKERSAADGRGRNRRLKNYFFLPGVA